MDPLSRPNHAQAPRRANGTCRNRRERRPAWVRQLARANRAIRATVRLANKVLVAVARADGKVDHCPIHASRRMHEATAGLAEAAAWLERAARALAKTNACVLRDPASALAVPQLLGEATQEWLLAAEWLAQVTADVFSIHEAVLHGLETGELVAEQPVDRRPRIVLAPRPVAMRAFLRRRQPRVIDRIAALLQRRRRTPRPAALSVPPRTAQGRAPPLFSICAL